MAIRLAHFSDVHLTARPLGFHPRDLVSKRFTGWLNVRMLGRGRSFRHAPAVMAALRRALKDRRPDALIFTGDATGLGFESEFVAASHALGVWDEDSPPGVAAPGNHDYYTARGVREQLFEQYFAPWLTGRRAVSEFQYPFARKIGDLWLIGANSCTPNRWNWDASGAFGPDQLDRLRKLCTELDPGPRLLVTHYPLRTATGLIEPRVHRLRDHAEALRTAIDCGIDLWLHGHIHREFVLKPTSHIPFPVVCVGSATQTNRWAYNEYTIKGRKLSIVTRTYNLAHDDFHDTGAFEIDLPGD